MLPVVALFIAFTVFKSGRTGELHVPDAATLCDGDLVFRRGISIESFAVVNTGTNKIYSHVGLIVIEKGIPFVIHAEPGEAPWRDKPVQKETLKSFLAPEKASRYAIYRSHLDRKNLGRVISRARSFYLGGSRFDNGYDLQDDHFLYCTELVFKAYREGDQRINCLTDKLEKVRVLIYTHNLLMPEALITSELFYKICNQ